MNGTLLSIHLAFYPFWSHNASYKIAVYKNMQTNGVGEGPENTVSPHKIPHRGPVHLHTIPSEFVCSFLRQWNACLCQSIHMDLHQN